MKRFCGIALLLLLTACATTAPPPNEPDADVLLKADREFARQSAATGSAAWLAFMAPNAVKPANGGLWLNGPEEIGQNMTIAFAGGFTLTWEPLHAEISRGGKLGYTWGRYHSTLKEKSRDGTYMTVWQKQPDGSWKVLFDTGDPD